LALFGRRPVERAERLFVAGVQKPAHEPTSRCSKPGIYDGEPIFSHLKHSSSFARISPIEEDSIQEGILASLDEMAIVARGDTR
jgi:hypothetical protein